MSQSEVKLKQYNYSLSNLARKKLKKIMKTVVENFKVKENLIQSLTKSKLHSLLNDEQRQALETEIEEFFSPLFIQRNISPVSLSL